jgi:RNA polymerase sigma-70 factor (ECF subfamily)
MGGVDTLFRAHHEALYRYAVRLTGDPDLAADATQEAFVRMIEGKPEGRNPRAWLFTVATNYVRERARTGSRRRELRAGATARLAPDRPATPEEVLDSTRAADRVRQGLDHLPERDRTLLLMREEGFTHREMAEAVGTTTGSVGTMIARALDKLALVLDLDGETEP